MMYFISDLHFGHKNCLAFDNRNFPSIEAHDNYLIKQWNEKVGPDDEVWILGDVSWHNVTRTTEIFRQLNGIKNLCIGNHDKNYLKNKDFRDCFKEICHYKEIEFNDMFIVLSHYCIPDFNMHYYGAYHLYGHVHTSWEWNMCRQWKYQSEALYDKPCRMYNVGCMIPEYNFAPQTLEEIVRIGEEIYGYKEID